MIVEVCSNSLESAVNAEKAGADRIELCAELGVGGITPSYGLLKAVRKRISIPVHVLVRPRSGDFTYSEVEFEILKADIELCVSLGFDGIVSGVLRVDNTLDIERTSALVALSRPLKFTFHRAFDWIPDPLIALSKLEEMGVDYILTSGQQKTAVEGIDLLSELLGMGSKTAIMPGSGINPKNVHRFRTAGFGAIHLSGGKFHKRLDVNPPISMNSPKFLTDDAIFVSDYGIIKEVVDNVKINRK